MRATLVLSMLLVAVPVFAQSPGPAARAEFAAWAHTHSPHADALTTALMAFTPRPPVPDQAVAGVLYLACQQLKLAVAAARADLPSPDVAFDDELIAALNEFDASAHHCIRGIKTVELSDIQAMTIHMRAGVAPWGRAAAIVRGYIN